MNNVSSLVITTMAFFIVLGLILLVAIFLLLRKRYKANSKALFIGAAVFIVFVILIESYIHKIVFSSSLGSSLKNNFALMALYGGAMAAVFEEFGRLISFKLFLRKEISNDNTALMYGLGHGGAELVALFVLTMINNIIISILINSGNTGLITASIKDSAASLQVNQMIQALINISPSLILIGLLERLIALCLQMSLSVLVWYSVKFKPYRYLFPLALFIHFAVDATTILINRYTGSVILTEATILVLTLVVAYYSYRLFRKHKT